MLMPSLLLQHPFRKSKTKDHHQCLERRLTLWAAGDIKDLLCEGRTILERISHFHHKQEADTARVFANLMFEGKVKAALRIFTTKGQSSFLSPNRLIKGRDKTVLDVLKEKHPEDQPLVPTCIADPANAESFHPVFFSQIDRAQIRSTILKTQGAAGPSGLDATYWRRLCTSFQKESEQLCDCLLYTSPSPRDRQKSRMPSSA